MKLKNKIIDSGNVYFMSDLHYNHENVLKMNNRNFSGISEMNEYIVDTLKNTIKPGDVIFELGDLFWKTDTKECQSVLESIPTKEIYKIIGNHDKIKLYDNGENEAPLKKYFKVITDMLDITIESGGKSYMVTLMHYPSIDWNGMYHGSLHIHGHTHGHLDEFEKNQPRLMVDVGFDAQICKNYGNFLIPFSEILRYMNEKTGEKDFYKWAKENYG